MTLTELESIYENAVKIANDEYDWYVRRRRIYFCLSYCARILAALAVIVGIILPLTSSTSPIDIKLLSLQFSGPAQAAVACIALAGALVGVHQIFMLSGTWIRYMNAMTKIKTLILASEYDWRSHRASISEPPTLEDVQKTLMLSKSLVLSARQVVETETAVWSAELVKAIDELRSLLNEHKAAVGALAKEEQATREAAQKTAMASTHGTVRIKLDGQVERLCGPLQISLASKTEKRDRPTSVVVMTGIVGGLHKITLNAQDANGHLLQLEDVVQVAPGAIADVTLLIPKV